MTSWTIYISFTFILLSVAFLVGVFQRRTLYAVLFVVSIVGMLIGSVLHQYTPTNDNRTYNNYCRISAHSYSKGFEEGVRVTKEEYEQEKEL